MRARVVEVMAYDGELKKFKPYNVAVPMLPAFLRKLFSKEVIGRSVSSQTGSPGPAIIFIHGMAGGPVKTWGKMIKVCVSDKDLNEYSVSCYTYPSGWLRPPLGRGTPKLQELARGLETELQTLHAGRKEIVLVAHSLGGLVARQYILSAIKGRRPLLATKLMLFAVPNTGAALAKLAKSLPLDDGALIQLGFGSDILDVINEDWVNYDIEARLPTKYVVAGADALVAPVSAGPYVASENVLTLIEHTHRSVVDPEGTNDIRYLLLRNFILDKSLANRRRGEQQLPVRDESFSRTADPLFDLFSKKDAKFYLERDCDAFLKTTMSTGHVWLFGPSGAGKTAALRYNALSSEWRLFHLMLASYQGSTALQLLHAICVEIADLIGINEEIDKSLGEASLFGLFRRYLRAMPTDISSTILIEEIPIPPGRELSAFLSLILNLILFLETDSAIAGRIQLAFSSINNPRSGGLIASAKIAEKLQLVAFDYWTEFDIGRLIGLLSPIVRPQLSEDEKKQLIYAACGSPRFVKMVFRRWRNGTANGLSTSQLLESVRSEL